MRKASSRVTLPISRAATLYCLAIARTAARFSGARETMARAPRSEKRADSEGAGSSRLTVALREEEVASGEWRVASEEEKSEVGTACRAPTRSPPAEAGVNEKVAK